MVFPPFQSRFHIPLLEIRVTLRHLKGPGNGVCGATHKILRGLIVRGVKERGYHDNAVHSQKVSIKRSLQGIILGNVLSPILYPLGSLHFKDSHGLTGLVAEKVVPHTTEDSHIGEEVTEGSFEVILPEPVSRSHQIAHEVGVLHILCLFRLYNLTGSGVNGVFKSLLVGTSDLAPHLKGSRPRVQPQNGSKPGCCQLLRTLGRHNLNSVVNPFHD